MMVDFLVIDEFDPRHMTEGASSDLFGRQMEDIFRRRSENKLPLFMCTNSPNVIDSFAGPIKQSIDSLMSYATVIPVLGKDFRKGGM
jgi:DNA replication protein DnaC